MTVGEGIEDLNNNTKISMHLMKGNKTMKEPVTKDTSMIVIDLLIPEVYKIVGESRTNRPLMNLGQSLVREDREVECNGRGTQGQGRLGWRKVTEPTPVILD